MIFKNNPDRFFIYRGYLFVFCGAIINQQTIISPLILHTLCGAFLFNALTVKVLLVYPA